jgi:hypothetical protein
LNLHEFSRGQCALSGLDYQTNFAAPRKRRSLRASIAVVALGAMLLLTACNDINPYLGAAATQSSTISYITPSSRPSGCSGFTLDIQGAGFVNDAVVSWNNSPRATNFESSSELLATINASDLATQGPVSIVVTTPALSGQQNQGNNLSNFVSFTIGPPPTVVPGQVATCPAPPTFPPTITALSTSSGTAAGPNNNPVGTTVEIAGNYFGGLQNNSTVTFNTTLPTPTSTTATVTSWSGTLVTVTLPAVPIPTGATSVAATIVITVGGVASQPLSPGANSFTVLPAPSTSSATILKSLSAVGTGNTIWSFSSTANPRYAALAAPSADLSAAGTGPDKIYLRDTCQGAPLGCSPTTTLVSVGDDGADPNGASRSPSVSASGRFVAYVSDASNLVPGDANGVADIFLRDTCVNAPTGCVPTTTRVSAGPDGAESNGASASPLISFDGRFVAFDSAASNLVSDSQVNTTGTSGGAFLWDTCFGVPQASDCTPSLTRLSVPSVAPHAH